MKKLHNLIDRFMKKVSQCSLILSSIVLLAAAILIFVDVFVRYVFNDPIPGQQELAELSMVVVVYFGLPWATRIRSHVRVEPITGKLPVSVRSILFGVLDFIVVAFMVLLTWNVFAQAGNLVATPGNATLILRIPYFYIYYIASVGAAISTLEFLMDGIRYIIEGVAAARGHAVEKGGRL